jgi:hypothetical protein
MGGRSGANLALEDTPRPDAQQKDRHREESQSPDRGREIRHPEKAFHDWSTDTRRGSISLMGPSPMVP